MKSIKRDQWRQIGGDGNPSQHGATIARFEGEAVEIRQIQPVREYVGDREALDVGFSFWTKEGWYDPADLSLDDPDVQAAMACVGLTVDDLPEDPDERAMCLAEACLSYGHRVDEGTSGWARDILGDTRVQWWHSKRPCGWRHLADEDREFRRLQRESKR